MAPPHPRRRVSAVRANSAVTRMAWQSRRTPGHTRSRLRGKRDSSRPSNHYRYATPVANIAGHRFPRTTATTTATTPSTTTTTSAALPTARSRASVAKTVTTGTGRSNRFTETSTEAMRRRESFSKDLVSVDKVKDAMRHRQAAGQAGKDHGAAIADDRLLSLQAGLGVTLGIVFLLAVLVIVLYRRHNKLQRHVKKRESRPMSRVREEPLTQRDPDSYSQTSDELRGDRQPIVSTDRQHRASPRVVVHVRTEFPAPSEAGVAGGGDKGDDEAKRGRNLKSDTHGRGYLPLGYGNELYHV